MSSRLDANQAVGRAQLAPGSDRRLAAVPDVGGQFTGVGSSTNVRLDDEAPMKPLSVAKGPPLGENEEWRA